MSVKITNNFFLLIQYIASNRQEPLFGICMGNQLMGLAAGANTYKLPLGNRWAFILQNFVYL